MKYKLIFFITLFILVSLVAISTISLYNYQAKVLLGGKEFLVDVSETEYHLRKGLSGHPGLKNNEGMLFIFKQSDFHGIWMKDMLFPIDIIWLDDKFTVIHIEKSVSPDTYPKIFTPTSPSSYVLEISAGQSSALGIKIGDKAKFDRKSF